MLFPPCRKCTFAAYLAFNIVVLIDNVCVKLTNNKRLSKRKTSIKFLNTF